MLQLGVFFVNRERTKQGLVWSRPYSVHSAIRVHTKPGQALYNLCRVHCVMPARIKQVLALASQ